MGFSVQHNLCLGFTKCVVIARLRTLRCDLIQSSLKGCAVYCGGHSATVLVITCFVLCPLVASKRYIYIFTKYKVVVMMWLCFTRVKY